MTGDRRTVEEVMAALARGDAMVCYAKCTPCQFGGCPGGIHGWAEAEDIAHAARTWQPAPTGRCGCACWGTDLEPIDYEPDPEFVSLNVSPCPLCGEAGPCGYDNEGRAMIHVMSGTEADEDEATS